MLTARWTNRLSWSVVLFALLLGIVTRDCVLIASAAMLAIYVARNNLRNREAVDLMRCAMHCWIVGAASMLIGLALFAMVVGMRAGLWEGNHLDISMLLLLVGLCSVTVSVLTRGDSPRGTDWRQSTAVTVSVVVFAFIARSFDAVGPCLFASGIAAVATVKGWQLARGTATQLARSTARM